MRGDLYRLKAPKDVHAHEQAGARYAVVVQSDDLPLSRWLIAPTSTGRRAASFRPEIEVDGTKTAVMVEQLAAVMVEQLAAVDPLTRLGAFAGRLGTSEMQLVDSALRAVLGLD
ncbi:MAG: type II toxin-antitoxin system PemK/MazF family toxin [Actinomycetota bacterium]|nr:type II toxin-antitoxin system PemK/MazF family toxin [Actinomycetota bacterium]